MINGYQYICYPDQQVCYVRVFKSAMTSIMDGLSDLTMYRSYTLPIDWFKFTCIRNPLERLVSAWAMFTQKYHNKLSFEEFAKRTISGWFGTDWHTIPQSRILEGIDIDLILRFDHLEEDWEKLNLPKKKLKKLNISNHDHWETYYSDELKERVKEFYKEDYGYLQ